MTRVLIRVLKRHERHLKPRNKKTENKSAIEKLKQMQSKLSENMNCEDEEEDLF